MATDHGEAHDSPSEPLRLRSSIASPDSHAAPSTTASIRDAERVPLAHRVERQQLRARIRALERELEASERRRRAIVRQYERILDDRDPCECTRPDAGARAALRRLLDGLP